MTTTVTIARFGPGDADAFAALNLAWLVPLALFEPADEKQLYGYHENVFARGGAIFMARAGDARVGCCAAIPHDEETIEPAKLAVDPSVQRNGVGGGWWMRRCSSVPTMASVAQSLPPATNWSRH